MFTRPWAMRGRAIIGEREDSSEWGSFFSVVVVSVDSCRNVDVK